MSFGVVCDPIAFLEWSSSLVPGSTITYYTGFSLARATITSRRKVEEVTNEVRNLYNCGRVILMQQRVGQDGADSIFAYRARVRLKPVKIDRQHHLPMVGEAL